MNMEEEKIFHQEYEESPFVSYFSNSYPFYEYHGQWYFYRLFDNTTYELGPNSMIEAYSWDFGKHNYSANKMEFPEALRNDAKWIEVAKQFPYWMAVQGQNNRYVMAQIRLNAENEYGNLMYDKSTQECQFIERFTESVGFRPLVVTNEYVLCHCYHGEWDKYVNEEMLDNTNKQKLVALMKAKAEANPLIIKYYFK